MTDESERRKTARAVFNRQVGGPPRRRTAPATLARVEAEPPPSSASATSSGTATAPLESAAPHARARAPRRTTPRETAQTPPAAHEPARADLPGAKVRHRQVLTVYLPAPEREHLYAVATEQGVSLGKAAVDALRDGYDRLEESMRPIAQSRFPDDRPRQRSGLDNPLQVSLSISAAQAAAVGEVLDSWGCTASELFTAALRLRVT